jgi:prophage tail gpP-like protein
MPPKGRNQSLSLHLIGDKSDPIVLWENFVLSEDFLDYLGSFETTICPPKERATEFFEKFKKGSIVQVRIGKVIQFTGVIMTQTTSISRNGTTIKIDCSGMLAAADEASISPRMNVSSKTDIPVLAFIEKNMALYFGPAYAKVENNSGLNLALKSGRSISGLPAPVPVTALKGRDFKAQNGESVYGFCQRLISRLGVILKTTAEGQLMLDRPIYDTKPLYTLIQSDALKHAGDYMMDGISITDTNSGQFSEIVVRGRGRSTRGTGAKFKVKEHPSGDPSQATVIKVAEATKGTRAANPYARVVDFYNKDPYDNPSPFSQKIGELQYIPADFSKQEPLALPYKNVPVFKIDENAEQRKLARYRYNSSAQFFKPRYIEDKKSGSVDRCKAWGFLAMGVPNGRGYTVTCTVNYFASAEGAIWTPNTVVKVKIDYLGIDEDMWIFRRVFRASRGGGQTTQLTLLPLNSLYIGKLPS